jgi:hypothetical protein
MSAAKLPEDYSILAADGRRKVELEAGTQLCSFVLSDNFVDIIQGPIGSGKSVGAQSRILRHAQQQRQSRYDGLRKSRWAACRNIYPDLKRSTIREWLEWFPEKLYGRFNWGQPPYHLMRFDDVMLHVDFLALDKPDDVSKLRSTQYTGIWFNEVQFSDKTIFDEMTSRVGRYPSLQEGGATWTGVIGDANAPDEDHWLALITGQVDLPPNMSAEERQGYQWPGDTWGFWKQPAALIERLDQHGRIEGYDINPGAENLRWLSPDYYPRLIAGKSKAWIDSRLMNRIALVVEGSPVWPMFREEVHVSREVLRPIEGFEVVIGLDFGRSAGVVFAQAVGNRLLVQHELVWNNTSTVDSAPMVKRFLTQHYPNCPYRAYGDPKGQDKGLNDDRTGYEIYAANGIRVMPPPGLKQNMISTRIDAVANLLNEMHDARPRFIMSPLCRTLKVAMAGRYHNEKDEMGILKPNKDRYSHICDALQYMCIGCGEGARMIGLTPAAQMKPVHAYRSRSLRRITA